MNDIRWTRGGRRGRRGPAAKTMHRTIRSQALYCAFGLQNLACWKLVVLTSKKLAFKFSTYVYLNISPSPLHLPRVHSRDECSQAFPVLIPCIIVYAKGRSKQGKPGTEATSASCIVLCPDPTTHAKGLAFRVLLVTWSRATRKYFRAPI